eukprot:scaffold10566_cov173-Isochrysis_galbana.AAC.2
MLAAAADLDAVAATAASAASSLDAPARADTASASWTGAPPPSASPPAGAASPRCASHRPPKMAVLLPFPWKWASRMASSAARRRSQAAMLPSLQSARSLRNCSQATTGSSPLSACSVAGGSLAILSGAGQAEKRAGAPEGMVAADPRIETSHLVLFWQFAQLARRRN